MMKKIILFILIFLAIIFFFRFTEEFEERAKKQTEQSLSVPQIKRIIKDVKGLKKTSQENVEKYNDSPNSE